eukprot:gnl/TRDRNA2_/TRDRNA2_194714_c0_seq1.p1 gnl/TRDRNA2_/TRDRNA2_194714_c0~~gnl/TRDRNA2_/TRDRNA2_194714_c0_seq1.p1  ORF type:complete len:574 (-),score=54.51 gnl/TRDRNA2_/TRDRNA2_194714_c0_seq1:142-1668(-)
MSEGQFAQRLHRCRFAAVQRASGWSSDAHLMDVLANRSIAWTISSHAGRAAVRTFQATGKVAAPVARAESVNGSAGWSSQSCSNETEWDFHDPYAACFAAMAGPPETLGGKGTSTWGGELSVRTRRSLADLLGKDWPEEGLPVVSFLSESSPSHGAGFPALPAPSATETSGWAAASASASGWAVRRCTAAEHDFSQRTGSNKTGWDLNFHSQYSSRDVPKFPAALPEFPKTTQIESTQNARSDFATWSSSASQEEWVCPPNIQVQSSLGTTAGKPQESPAPFAELPGVAGHTAAVTQKKAATVPEHPPGLWLPPGLVPRPEPPVPEPSLHEGQGPKLGPGPRPHPELRPGLEPGPGRGTETGQGPGLGPSSVPETETGRGPETGPGPRAGPEPETVPGLEPEPAPSPITAARSAHKQTDSAADSSDAPVRRGGRPPKKSVLRSIVGKWVLITGLANDSDFNGEWGHVHSYDTASQRFIVAVQRSSGEAFAAKLRLENLMVPSADAQAK